MHGDGRVDQIAAKGPKPSEYSILVSASKPGVADDVGHQDRGEFPGLAHGAIAEAGRSPVEVGWAWLHFHAALIGMRPGMQTRRFGSYPSRAQPSVTCAANPCETIAAIGRVEPHECLCGLGALRPSRPRSTTRETLRDNPGSRAVEASRSG